MNVILTESVKGLGKPGDQVSVARGYAENFLLPKGLAVEANPQNLRIWEQKKAKIEAKEAELREGARVKAEKLASKKISISAKVGAEDKLYGSVTNKDIVDAVKDQLGLEIEKKDVIISEPIKQLGEFVIKVDLFADVQGEIQVEVVPSAD